MGRTYLAQDWNKQWALQRCDAVTLRTHLTMQCHIPQDLSLCSTCCDYANNKSNGNEIFQRQARVYSLH